MYVQMTPPSAVAAPEQEEVATWKMHQLLKPKDYSNGQVPPEAAAGLTRPVVGLRAAA